jgi:hypothetical protein
MPQRSPTSAPHASVAWPGSAWPMARRRSRSLGRSAAVRRALGSARAHQPATPLARAAALRGATGRCARPPPCGCVCRGCPRRGCLPSGAGLATAARRDDGRPDPALLLGPLGLGAGDRRGSAVHRRDRGSRHVCRGRHAPGHHRRQPPPAAHRRSRSGIPLTRRPLAAPSSARSATRSALRWPASCTTPSPTTSRPSRCRLRPAVWSRGPSPRRRLRGACRDRGRGDAHPCGDAGHGRVLRQDGEGRLLPPQPGVADLPALAAGGRDPRRRRLAHRRRHRLCPDPWTPRSTGSRRKPSPMPCGMRRSATHVAIDLRRVGDNVRLRVTDDGLTHAGPRCPPGFGVTGMAERAQLLGGSLTCRAGARGRLGRRGRSPRGGFAMRMVRQ